MSEMVIASVLEAAKTVNNALYPESSERNYHNAFEVELNHRKIDFVSEPKFPNLYRGFEVGYVNPDLILNRYQEDILIELKTSKSPDTVDDQIEYYMNSYVEDCIGLVICFNEDIEYKIYEDT